MRINRGIILWFIIISLIFSLSNGAVLLGAENSENIKVTEQLLLINYINQQFEIKELYQFTIPEGKNFAGDLIINVPKGAENIYISKKELSDQEKTTELDPQKYRITDNQITINESLQSKGSISLLVFYTIDSLEISRVLYYPTEQVYILVPMGLNLVSDSLHNLGIKVLDETHFQTFGSHGLNKGENFSLTVKPAAVGETRVTKEYQSTTGFHSPAHLTRWANSPLANTNPHLWLIFLFLLGLGFLCFILSLTVYQNLDFYGQLYNVKKLKERIYELISQVGLELVLHEPFYILSRGMQQRLAIARALIQDPGFLLLDEPQTGLDQDAVKILYSLLASLKMEDKGIVVVTHLFDDLFQISDKLLILKKGRQIYYGDIRFPLRETKELYLSLVAGR